MRRYLAARAPEMTGATALTSAAPGWGVLVVRRVQGMEFRRER
jgi:hypothetical protein